MHLRFLATWLSRGFSSFPNRLILIARSRIIECPNFWVFRKSRSLREAREHPQNMEQDFRGILDPEFLNPKYQGHVWQRSWSIYVAPANLYVLIIIRIMKSFLGSVTVFRNTFDLLVGRIKPQYNREIPPWAISKCQLVGLTNMLAIQNACNGSSSTPCSSQYHPTKIQSILRFSNSRFDRKSCSVFCGCSLASGVDRLFRKTQKFGHSMIRDLAIKIGRFGKFEKWRLSCVAKNLRCTYFHFFCWANHIYIYI